MTWSDIQYYDKFAYQIAYMDRETSVGLIGPWGGDDDVVVILGFKPEASEAEQESAIIPSYIDGYPVCYIDDGDGSYTEYISFTGNTYLHEVVFPITLMECKRELFAGCTNLTSVVINHLFASYHDPYAEFKLFTNCPNLYFILNRSRYKITKNDFGSTLPRNLTIYMLDNSSWSDSKGYGRVLQGANLTPRSLIKMLYVSSSDDGSEISLDYATPLLAVIQNRKALIVGTIKGPLDTSYSDYLSYPACSYAHTQVDSDLGAPVKIYIPSPINIGKPGDGGYALYTSDYFQTNSTITINEQIDEFVILPYAFCGFDSITSVGLEAKEIGDKAFLNSFDSHIGYDSWSASVISNECWIGADNLNYTRYFESYLYDEGGLGMEPYAVAETLNNLDVPLTYGCKFTEWKTITEATCESTGLQAKFCVDRFQYRGADLEQYFNNHIYTAQLTEAHPNRTTTVQPATCMKLGVEKKICADYGKVFSTKTIAKLEHSLKFKSRLSGKEATCTEDGYSSGEVWECENCGYLDYRGMNGIISKLGHSFEESKEGEVYCSTCNIVLSGAHKYFWKKAKWIQNKINLPEISGSFPDFEYDKILKNTFARDAFNLQRQTCKAYAYLAFYDTDIGCGVTATEATYDIANVIIPAYSPKGELVKEIFYFIDYDNIQSIRLPKGLEFIETNTVRGCYGLNKIIYNGTMTEWENISKGENWNLGVPADVVQCTDGNLSLE